MCTSKMRGAFLFFFTFQCSSDDSSFYQIAAAVLGIVTRMGESETSVQKLDRGRNGRTGEGRCECRDEELEGAEHRGYAASSV